MYFIGRIAFYHSLINTSTIPFHQFHWCRVYQMSVSQSPDILANILQLDCQKELYYEDE